MVKSPNLLIYYKISPELFRTRKISFFFSDSVQTLGKERLILNVDAQCSVGSSSFQPNFV